MLGGGGPDHMLSTGGPEVGMIHLCLGKSLQGKSTSRAPKKVRGLMSSIIQFRNTECLLQAVSQHAQHPGLTGLAV